MTWQLHPAKPVWQLTHEGRVLDTLTWNRERNEYVNAHNDSMGKAWDEARRKCEERALRPKRRTA